mmetsp:Transcript_10007/g.22021  ORF Transcript_10007/g.22021 Transcript_10007/m.22021 type:complete len:575 (-) Transcript_10007:42-1766(-)
MKLASAASLLALASITITLLSNFRPATGLKHLSRTAVLQRRTNDAHRGLNLPPTQGTTRDGAFFPGVYNYGYDAEEVKDILMDSGFAAVRLAVNLDTAQNLTALQKLKHYIDSINGKGIICMFDNSAPQGKSWPRSGNITGKISSVALAWKQIHAVFEPYGQNVLYELFNEPWGYGGNAEAYVGDMRQVISEAGLPQERVILAGLWGSADVQKVARAGWTGYLAYHFYAFWLPPGKKTRKNFKQALLSALDGLSNRTFITEFGTGLDDPRMDVEDEDDRANIQRYGGAEFSSDWLDERPSKGMNVQTLCKDYPDNTWCANMLRGRSFGQLRSDPSVALGADVQARIGGPHGTPQDPVVVDREAESLAFLGGLRDALRDFEHRGAGLRGLYHWHGWHNGDTWDFWDEANAKSSQMIQSIMADMAQGRVAKDGDDPFFSEDFVEDDGSLAMAVAHHMGRNSKTSKKSNNSSSSTASIPLAMSSARADCPNECFAQSCSGGDIQAEGGRLMTGDHCIHLCSVPYSGRRYCGAGAAYMIGDFVDCSGCARPRVCGGLPCWARGKSQGNESRETKIAML